MSSLPPRLRPLWPVFKRAHLLLSFALGFLTRRAAPLLGDRGVPRRAYFTSKSAAAAEPRRITLVPAGPAYRMSRALPEGNPADHPAFRAGETVEVPERYVLEVDGGRIVGDFGALVTPDGRLDFETSWYFGLTRWRQHPMYLKPTVGDPRHVQGRVLSLTSPGTATNYYHFLYDSVGRLEVVEASGVDRDFDAVVVPHGSGYQRELLELMGVDAPLIQLNRGQSVVADQLVVPSTPNSQVIAPSETVEWLRKNLLPSGAGPAGSERIYITRGDARGSRRYLQESELWPSLEARGFQRVDPGSLSVHDQIALFSGAGLVVSPHGAGLTNITFAPRGVQVLELFAPTYVHLGLWGICEALGHVRYRYLVGEREGRFADWPRPFDDISLDPRKVIDAVDHMIADLEATGPAVHS